MEYISCVYWAAFLCNTVITLVREYIPVAMHRRGTIRRRDSSSDSEDDDHDEVEYAGAGSAAASAAGLGSLTARSRQRVMGPGDIDLSLASQLPETVGRQTLAATRAYRWIAMTPGQRAERRQRQAGGAPYTREDGFVEIHRPVADIRTLKFTARLDTATPDRKRQIVRETAHRLAGLLAQVGPLYSDVLAVKVGEAKMRVDVMHAYVAFVVRVPDDRRPALLAKLVSAFPEGRLRQNNLYIGSFVGPELGHLEGNVVVIVSDSVPLTQLLEAIGLIVGFLVVSNPDAPSIEVSHSPCFAQSGTLECVGMFLEMPLPFDPTRYEPAAAVTARTKLSDVTYRTFAHWLLENVHDGSELDEAAFLVRAMHAGMQWREWSGPVPTFGSILDSVRRGSSGSA